MMVYLKGMRGVRGDVCSLYFASQSSEIGGILRDHEGGDVCCILKLMSYDY